MGNSNYDTRYLEGARQKKQTCKIRVLNFGGKINFRVLSGETISHPQIKQAIRLNFVWSTNYIIKSYYSEMKTPKSSFVNSEGAIRYTLTYSI